MKIKITNDLFDIASRVKEIYEGYEIYFDTTLQKFVLWGDGKQQLVFPFDTLDARALEYTRKTGVKYADEIVAEIDKQNERIEKERILRTQDKVEDELSRRLRLAHI